MSPIRPFARTRGIVPVVGIVCLLLAGCEKKSGGDGGGPGHFLGTAGLAFAA